MSVPALVAKELQRIPGVGPSIAADLYALGIVRASDLRGDDPGKLYEKSCELAGVRIDRCLLYVYRCAVYFASNIEYYEHLLQWLAWEDKQQ